MYKEGGANLCLAKSMFLYRDRTISNDVTLISFNANWKTKLAETIFLLSLKNQSNFSRLK